MGGELVKVVPAVAAPARAGLDLSVTQLESADGEELVLGAGGGEIVLTILPAKGHFFVSHGELRLARAPSDSGVVFADVVAAWLGLELVQTSKLGREVGEGQLSWALLGGGRDPFGVEWEAFKVFLAVGGEHAEVFLRLTPSRNRGQLVEKWSGYREGLVLAFERLVGASPPRGVRRRPTPPLAMESGRRLAIEGGLELEVPKGWLLVQRPEGHWRMTDADDEMMIEVSCLALPPLPPDVPSVSERVRQVVDSSEHAATATPVAAFERDDVEFAWSEYRFESSDSHQPDEPKKLARGRWLLCANDWFQGLVTGSWWEKDVAIAEIAWYAVVGSIRLSGRVREDSSPPTKA
jgi:hypothetical protein